MLVEKGIEEAMEAFAKGRIVLAMSTLADGNLAITDLIDVFPEGTRYLVEEVEKQV